MRNSVVLNQDHFNASGFSLIELIVTLAVAAIILGIAIPNLTAFLQNNRLSTVANDILHSIQLARTEAIKRPQTVVVCASTNQDPITVACTNGVANGWLVFADINGDFQRQGGEPLIELHPAIDPSVRVRTDGNGLITYGPTGNPAAPAAQRTGNIVVCDSRGNVVAGGNSIERTILINTQTGTARVSRTAVDVTAALIATGGC